MSYYYCYRLGRKKDGKLYPLYPFTADGKWKDIISRSRSFESGLNEEFYPVRADMLSDEFKKIIKDSYLDQTKSVEECVEDTVPYIKWLPLKELPSEDFIKRGYFLIADVEQYEKALASGESTYMMDIFYDSLSTTVYNSRLKHAMMLGDDCIKDEDGGIIQHSIKDYMYYAYPDYECKEYDSFLLRASANACELYDKEKYGEIVVIDWEG